MMGFPLIFLSLIPVQLFFFSGCLASSDWMGRAGAASSASADFVPDSEGETKAVSKPAGPVSKMRLESILREKTFTCAYAPGKKELVRKAADGSPAGVEPELIREIAKRLGFRVRFLELSREAIPGMLRSGRADIASAGLGKKSIESLSLKPVLFYSRGKDPQNPAFLIRADDPEWEALLEEAFAGIDFEFTPAMVNEAEIRLISTEPGSLPPLTVDVEISGEEVSE